MSESIEVKRALDYLPGDLVQMVSREHPGVLGTVIGTKLSKGGKFLLYQIQIPADKEDFEIILAKANEFRFLSHQEDE